LAAAFSFFRWLEISAPSAGAPRKRFSDPGKFQAVDFQIVLPGYFESMRTPLIAGRTFTDADNVPGRKPGGH